MEFKTETVTPDAAKLYLRYNTRNRRVDPERVALYAKQMQQGKWKNNTFEFIKISTSGVVLDGQHRLLGVVKSGVPVCLQIATGLDPDVFSVLDTGKTRNATDVFSIEKIKQGSTIPSIINNYNLLKNGFSLAGSKVDKKMTNNELLAEYYKNEIYWQAVATKAHRWYNAFAKILPPSTIGAFFVLFSNKSGPDAEAFFEQLATGLDVTNQVVAMLRQKLMADKMAIRKMQATVKNALIIKSWNYFRKNDQPKLLTFNPLKDNFPAPK